MSHGCGYLNLIHFIFFFFVFSTEWIFVQRARTSVISQKNLNENGISAIKIKIMNQILHFCTFSNEFSSSFVVVIHSWRPFDLNFVSEFAEKNNHSERKSSTYNLAAFRHKMQYINWTPYVSFSRFPILKPVLMNAQTNGSIFVKAAENMKAN